MTNPKNIYWFWWSNLWYRKGVVERKNQKPDMSWNEFFEKLDWFQLLEESKVINNAIEYILEGQARSKRLSILTKIHTLVEMEAKK